MARSRRSFRRFSTAFRSLPLAGEPLLGQQKRLVRPREKPATRLAAGNRRPGDAFLGMLKKIAFAVVLIQVAAFSALLTHTVLFASTASQAANVQQDETVAVTESECAEATWTNIPRHCLKRVEARTSITTFVLTPKQ
jgi:hypothetical protein